MLIWIARLIARLPLHWLQALGAALGRLTVLLSPAFREKTALNLSQAGLLAPGMAGRVAAHTGRAVAETAVLWFGERERVESLIRIEGQQVLDEARRAGRGAIMLTPHLGSFEAGARAVARTGPFTVLYKPARIGALRRLVDAGRGTPGLKPVPATAAGVRSVLKALRRGEAVGILPDQVPSDGDGEWASFFGRPAYTMTLPARLAKLTGAPVIVGFAERLPEGGGWLAHLEPLNEPPTPAAINRAMEAVIRRIPEQYFWGYNRYKTPPRAQAASGRTQGVEG